MFFNESAEKKIAKIAPEAYQPLYIEHQLTTAHNQTLALDLVSLRHAGNPADSGKVAVLLDKLKAGQKAVDTQRAQITKLIKQHKNAVAEPDTDSNYIFLHFVRNYLPAGMIGLLFAIIFLASWGSISAAINSLASSTLVDFHQVFAQETLSDQQQLKYGRYYTLLWGLFSIAVAMFATKMGSLIEAVNELGSLFYGAILGIFLTAFFFKKIKGKAVFYAAISSEVLVLLIYIFKWVAFLWLNVIGALLVILIAWLLQVIGNKRNAQLNL